MRNRNNKRSRRKMTDEGANACSPFPHIEHAHTCIVWYVFEL